MISPGSWSGAAAAEWVRECSDRIAPGHPRRAYVGDYRCPAGRRSVLPPVGLHSERAVHAQDRDPRARSGLLAQRA